MSCSTRTRSCSNRSLRRFVLRLIVVVLGPAVLALLGARIAAAAKATDVDLATSLTHMADFPLGVDSDILVTVTNLGPGNLSDVMTVTVELPAGLVYVDADGKGWTIDAGAEPVITATFDRTVSHGRSAPALTVTVQPDGSVTGPVTLAASVTSLAFDPQPANNDATSVVNVGGSFTPLVAVKSLTTVEDPFNGTVNPKTIPGAYVEYAVEISNRLADRIDDDSIVFVDAVPAGTTLFVGDLPGGAGPVRFSHGAVRSRLNFTFGGLTAPTDDLDFSADGGATWTYGPTPDAFGCDAAVTHIRVTPGGRMAPRTAAVPPSFILEFRVRMD